MLLTFLFSDVGESVDGQHVPACQFVYKYHDIDSVSTISARSVLTMILSVLPVLVLSNMVLSAPRQDSRQEKPGYLQWYSRLYNLNYLPPDDQVADWNNPWTFSPSFPTTATQQDLKPVEKRSRYLGKQNFRLLENPAYLSLNAGHDDLDRVYMNRNSVPMMG